MADIARGAGLNSEDSALQGASQIFGYLWGEAWRYGHDTAAGDAEALHDMRVKLRRLRTAMKNFEGPKDAPILSSHLRRELREQSAHVVKLGDALGAVRDFDVLRDYVTDYARKKLEADAELVEGLDKFLHYLKLRRAKAFKPMVKRIRRAQKAGAAREQFARWALGLPAADGAAISLETAGKLILPRCLSEVQTHAGALDPGAHPEAHHDLRKAIRRVRYTLEIFSVCLETDVKPSIKKMVAMQDLLGEMQDHEVIAQTCARCFGKTKPQSIVDFNEYGARRISYSLGRVRTKWDESQQSGLWAELANL